VVKHEFEDSALLKVFGQAGAGLFFAPSAIREHICQQYAVKALGEIPVVDSFYALSVERRLKNPAVVAICNAARHRLFGSQDSPENT
jgi:LysR family transcriptional activator of nhaA